MKPCPLGQHVRKKMYSFYHDYRVVIIFPAAFVLGSFKVRPLTKLIPKIMYEISTHFFDYIPIATSPQTTQKACAAISIAPTGKKSKF